MTDAELDALCERLNENVHRGAYAPGTGWINVDGTSGFTGGGKIMELKNPNGPQAVDAIRSLRARIATLERMDAEAGEYVESVIAMRTRFTGDEPYVGWKGLGLALNEELDERDALRSECAELRAELANYRAEDYDVLVYTAAERDALRSECAELRRDAERYRWLTEPGERWYIQVMSDLFDREPKFCVIGEKLSAAIDAAMQEPLG